MKLSRSTCNAARLLGAFAVCMAAPAAPPPLRQQVLLNGEWPEGGTVPVYEGVETDRRTYQREVAVPAAWAGRAIRVEFENVAFIADVSVNGEHLVQHLGAWNPFSVDVTRFARPGAAFTLRVEVKGPKHAPITNAAGGPDWPVGGWFGKKLGGICGDVWLRAYGEVAIEDAFIQTSFRKKQLTVEYTLSNHGPAARTVTVIGEAAPAAGGKVAKTIRAAAVTLQPGESRTVTAVAPWADAELWWPDRPALYHLTSRVVENSATLDQETRRFGFREIWTEGNQFRCNGIRANLFGDYQVFGDPFYTPIVLQTPANWPATIDRMKSMNIRILRWHHNPVPQYVLDASDEKGLLICDEAANYARDYHKKSNQAEYLKNTRHWIEAWVKADRNHPSVYMWNATNEMTYSFAGPFPAADLRRLGETIRLFDRTRPVGYDGDEGVVDGLLDYHYPEGYNKEPVGSIYGWSHLVQRDIPTGSGELLHTRSPLPEVQLAVARNTWWLGIWLRGLRYTNWTNVKPASYWIPEKDGFQGPRTVNLRNALAPVALFDKEYDDLGISPYVTGLQPGGVLPALPAGIRVTRTLVLYNDEFRGHHRRGRSGIARGRRSVRKDETQICRFARRAHRAPLRLRGSRSVRLGVRNGPAHLQRRPRQLRRNPPLQDRRARQAGAALHPHRLRAVSEAPSHHLEDQALQVLGFGHGQQNRVIL